MTRLKIEVVYACSHTHVMRCVELESGKTIADAIAESGLCRDFPEIDLARNRVGIFGQRLAPDTLLCDRDRVEVYRPLVADAKLSRRRRAEYARRSKK